MDKYNNLGQIFHDFRENRNIKLKQIADENVSVSQLSRFERGKADLSITKFLHALQNMHVEVTEFMETVNNYEKSETIEFMSKLVPLEYNRDIKGFNRLLNEQKEKYSQNPSVYQYHLNMILAQGFICKCDESIPFPENYMDEITDYLFCVEEWKIYELILIGNLYLFMNINLLHRMGQEIINKCNKSNTNTGLTRITLLNIFETCIHRNELEIADYYKNIIWEKIKNETLLYERNIFLFLDGLLLFKKGNKSVGMEQMEQSIQIYNWLKCNSLADNYKNDLAKHTT